MTDSEPRVFVHPVGDMCIDWREGCISNIITGLSVDHSSDGYANPSYYCDISASRVHHVRVGILTSGYMPRTCTNTFLTADDRNH